MYFKMHHIERQNDFWTKNTNNRCLSKIREYWMYTELHICITQK